MTLESGAVGLRLKILIRPNVIHKWRHKRIIYVTKYNSDVINHCFG